MNQSDFERGVARGIEQARRQRNERTKQSFGKVVGWAFAILGLLIVLGMIIQAAGGK